MGGRVGCLHCAPVSPNGHLLAGEINSGKFGIYLDSQWKPKAGDHQFEETYISELLPLEYTQMNIFSGFADLVGIFGSKVSAL